MSGEYNGFTGRYRDAVQRTQLEPRWASGEWPRPTVCDACWQDAGAIHGHLEDYDRPETYIPLCITCHLTLHTRFRLTREQWDAYRDFIGEGGQMPPLEHRSAFPILQRTVFAGDLSAGTPHVNPRHTTFLDTLSQVRLTAPPLYLWTPRAGAPTRRTGVRPG